MILYVPRSSVTVERDFSISAGLLASTDTPGRTAPLWSFTTPVNVLCARVSGTNAVKYSNDTKTPMPTRPVLDFLILSSPSNAHTERLSSNGGGRSRLRSLAHPTGRASHQNEREADKNLIRQHPNTSTSEIVSLSYCVVVSSGKDGCVSGGGGILG